VINGENIVADVSQMLLYDDSVRELDVEEKEQLTYNSTGEYFEVEDILELTLDNNEFKFLIKWRGFDDSENSWVSLDSLLEDVPTLVKAYLKGNKEKEIVKKVLQKYKGVRL
jgi:hypothetical protein